MSRLPKDLSYEEFKDIWLKFNPMCGRSFEEYYQDLKRVTRNNPTRDEVRYLYDDYIGYIDRDVQKLYKEYKEDDIPIETEETNYRKIPYSALCVFMSRCTLNKLTFPVVYVARYSIDKNETKKKFILTQETPHIRITKDNILVTFRDKDYWNQNTREYETQKEIMDELQCLTDGPPIGCRSEVIGYSVELLDNLNIEVIANPDMREFDKPANILSLEENIIQYLNNLGLPYCFLIDREEGLLKKSLKKLDKKKKVSMINYSLFLGNEFGDDLLKILQLRVIGLMTLIMCLKDGNDTKGLTLNSVREKIQLRITKTYNKEENKYFHFYIYCLYHLNTIIDLY